MKAAQAKTRRDGRTVKYRERQAKERTNGKGEEGGKQWDKVEEYDRERESVPVCGASVRKLL